jgi:glycosyltransferase involved in cell wall biosynthesis
MARLPSRAFCLDVTRLVSRVGGGPETGIDRVERAYLREVISWHGPIYGLARTVAGQVLLDRGGLEALEARLAGLSPWGWLDAAGRISFRLPRERRAAESDLRRWAIGRAGRRSLGGLLSERLPRGSAYLNVGHANLDDDTLAALRLGAGARVAVLIHDTIPLRLPATQRPGASDRFRIKLEAVTRHAEIVITSSEAERRNVAQAIRDLGGTPEIIVAPLGIDVVTPDRSALGRLDLPPAPWFVVVGTLEPRKNIGLLLDVWDRMAVAPPAGGLPGLVLVGRRGWEAPAFFRRLDEMKSRVPVIREYNDLDDGARAAVVSESRALLFPSLAEGYGLPPLEALALGVPVVCSPLEVYRETVGDAAVYAAADDMYQWASIVGALASGAWAGGQTGVRLEGARRVPDWSDHFNRVLSTIR